MTNRRNFLKSLGIGVVAGAVGIESKVANAATYRVVVVGGGFAGATVAKYLKLWGGASVDVTLVDKVATYKSPILSNLVLNGQKSMSNISFLLSDVATRNGFKYLQGELVGLDSTIPAGYNGRASVKKSDGSLYTDSTSQTLLSFHKLVVAPGVDFDYSNLTSLVVANGAVSDLKLPIPHAWKSGDQVLNLKAQIDNMLKVGGDFILSIPKSPYRCPPGPYERACVVADYIRSKQKSNKVIVLDSNVPTDLSDPYTAIQAEQHTFKTAFTGQFANIVKYYSAAKVDSVSSSGGQFGTKSITVNFNDGIGPQTTYTGRVLNVLPPMKAGNIASTLGLLGSGKFVPVDLLSYKSQANSNIHVIGDAHDSTQPKAGHIGSSEAKICAEAILREFGIIDSSVQYHAPVTNSSCYSPITSSTASWLTAGYRYDSTQPINKQMVRVPESFAEASSVSSDNYKMMLAWAANLFADVF